MTVSVEEATRRYSTRVKAPATLEFATKLLRFGSGEAMRNVPDVVEDALNEATAAYIRSRRDPVAFQSALAARIPDLTRAVSIRIEEVLREVIQFDAEDLRSREGDSEDADAKTIARELPMERAILRWLFGTKKALAVRSVGR